MKKLLAYLLICVMALTAVTAGLAEAADGEAAAEEKTQISYDLFLDLLQIKYKSIGL